MVLKTYVTCKRKEILEEVTQNVISVSQRIRKKEPQNIIRNPSSPESPVSVLAFLTPVPSYCLVVFWSQKSTDKKFFPKN